MEFSNLHRAVKTYLRYHAHCSKPASLILVLIFSHSFVKYGLVAVLVSYLTSRSNTSDLLSAAMVTNVQEGLASVFAIVVAHVADTRLGQFRMTILSSLAYLFGLLLLWLLNMVNKLGYGTLMVAVMLISFGQAGREPTMKALFADQLRNADNGIDNEDRLDACTTFWWRIMRSSGAIVATLLLTFLDLSWGLRFGIATVVMGIGFLIFLSGLKIYHPPQEQTRSSLTTVFHVLVAALSKQGFPLSDDPNSYYKNTNGEQPLMPDISLFRWLDKASLVTTSTPSLEQQEMAWKLCTVSQVKNVKLLIRMSPLWVTFFVYSLVSAAGSTFFFEQSSNLNNQIYIGVYINVPLTLFFFIQKASGSAISSMYELLIPRNWSVGKTVGATKLRMGVGMVFSCLCCVVAWQVETRRLKKLAEYTAEQLENENTNMSIYFLAPQFCLLGFMEGLARDGLYDFFHYHVDSMRSYGPSFNEFVLGIGKFNSILFMLIFQSWFSDTIDDSKVNKYYGVLALACLGNLFIFIFVVKYVYKDAKGRMKDWVDEMEQDGKRIQSIENSSNENPHDEGDTLEM